MDGTDLMKASISLVISLLISITSLEGRDQNLAITSIQASGGVTWTSSIEGVLEYRVQVADALPSGSWTNDLIGIFPTGSTMSVSHTTRGHLIGTSTITC